MYVRSIFASFSTSNYLGNAAIANPRIAKARIWKKMGNYSKIEMYIASMIFGQIKVDRNNNW